MKTIIAFLTAVCGLGTAAEAREFTARDGRRLEAEIVSCSGRSGRVEIRRADGAVIAVNIGAFSPEDQAYIRQWIPVSSFMSDRSFPLVVSRVDEKSWSREHESTMGGMGGMGGQSGGGGGGGGMGGGMSESSAEVIATDKYQRYRYDIRLMNRGAVPLQGLDVEYCIYYEQERAVADSESFGSTQQQQNFGRQNGPPNSGQQSQGFYMAEPELKVTKGRKHIAAIDPNGRTVLSSDHVTILNRDASGSGEGELIDLDGKIKGVWVKVSMPAPDGTTRTREILMPRSIRSQVEWKPVS